MRFMGNPNKAMNAKLSEQKGMSLVEVLIALSLLMIIVAVIMPIFLSGFQNVRDLKSQIAADQLANAQIEMARESSTTCANLQTFANAASNHADTKFTIAKSSITCPTSFPDLVDFSVSISEAGEVLSTLSTRILVTQ